LNFIKEVSMLEPVKGDFKPTAEKFLGKEIEIYRIPK